MSFPPSRAQNSSQKGQAESTPAMRLFFAACRIQVFWRARLMLIRERQRQKELETRLLERELQLFKVFGKAAPPKRQLSSRRVPAAVVDAKTSPENVNVPQRNETPKQPNSGAVLLRKAPLTCNDVEEKIDLSNIGSSSSSSPIPNNNNNNGNRYEAHDRGDATPTVSVPHMSVSSAANIIKFFIRSRLVLIRHRQQRLQREREMDTKERDAFRAYDAKRKPSKTARVRVQRQTTTTTASVNDAAVRNDVLRDLPLTAADVQSRLYNPQQHSMSSHQTAVTHDLPQTAADIAARGLDSNVGVPTKASSSSHSGGCDLPDMRNSDRLHPDIVDQLRSIMREISQFREEVQRCASSGDDTRTETPGIIVTQYTTSFASLLRRVRLAHEQAMHQLNDPSFLAVLSANSISEVEVNELLDTSTQECDTIQALLATLKSQALPAPPQPPQEKKMPESSPSEQSTKREMTVDEIKNSLPPMDKALIMIGQPDSAQKSVPHEDRPLAVLNTEEESASQETLPRVREETSLLAIADLIEDEETCRYELQTRCMAKLHIVKSSWNDVLIKSLLDAERAANLTILRSEAAARQVIIDIAKLSLDWVASRVRAVVVLQCWFRSIKAMRTLRMKQQRYEVTNNKRIARENTTTNEDARGNASRVSSERLEQSLSVYLTGQMRESAAVCIQRMVRGLLGRCRAAEIMRSVRVAILQRVWAEAGGSGSFDTDEKSLADPNSVTCPPTPHVDATTEKPQFQTNNDLLQQQQNRRRSIAAVQTIVRFLATCVARRKATVCVQLRKHLTQQICIMEDMQAVLIDDFDAQVDRLIHDGLNAALLAMRQAPPAEQPCVAATQRPSSLVAQGVAAAQLQVSSPKVSQVVTRPANGDVRILAPKVPHPPPPSLQQTSSNVPSTSTAPHRPLSARPVQQSRDSALVAASAQKRPITASAHRGGSRTPYVHTPYVDDSIDAKTALRSLTPRTRRLNGSGYPMVDTLVDVIDDDMDEYLALDSPPKVEHSSAKSRIMGCSSSGAGSDDSGVDDTSERADVVLPTSPYLDYVEMHKALKEAVNHAFQCLTGSGGGIATPELLDALYAAVAGQHKQPDVDATMASLWEDEAAVSRMVARLKVLVAPQFFHKHIFCLDEICLAILSTLDISPTASRPSSSAYSSATNSNQRSYPGITLHQGKPVVLRDVFLTFTEAFVRNMQRVAEERRAFDGDTVVHCFTMLDVHRERLVPRKLFDQVFALRVPLPQDSYAVGVPFVPFAAILRRNLVHSALTCQKHLGNFLEHTLLKDASESAKNARVHRVQTLEEQLRSHSVDLLGSNGTVGERAGVSLVDALNVYVAFLPSALRHSVRWLCLSFCIAAHSMLISKSPACFDGFSDLVKEIVELHHAEPFLRTSSADDDMSSNNQKLWRSVYDVLVRLLEDPCFTETLRLQRLCDSQTAKKNLYRKPTSETEELDRCISWSVLDVAVLDSLSFFASQRISFDDSLDTKLVADPDGFLKLPGGAMSAIRLSASSHKDGYIQRRKQLNSIFYNLRHYSLCLADIASLQFIERCVHVPTTRAISPRDAQNHIVFYLRTHPKFLSSFPLREIEDSASRPLFTERFSRMLFMLPLAGRSASPVHQTEGRAKHESSVTPTTPNIKRPQSQDICSPPSRQNMSAMSSPTPGSVVHPPYFRVPSGESQQDANKPVTSTTAKRTMVMESIMTSFRGFMTTPPANHNGPRVAEVEAQQPEVKELPTRDAHRTSGLVHRSTSSAEHAGTTTSSGGASSSSDAYRGTSTTRVNAAARIGVYPNFRR